MSLTLNMVGGGGGGLSATDALLRVQATAGSTVVATKGTVTKTDLGHENADDNTVYDYYFIIHQSQFDGVNPWTVTATLGSYASVDTIIIDAPNEYDISLTPILPIEYQAVEYLRSTGTQYIKTGITSGFTVGAELTHVSRSSFSYFGADMHLNNYDGNMRVTYQEARVGTSTVSSTLSDAWHDLVFNNSSHAYIVDGISKGTLSNGLNSSYRGEIYMFALNTRGTANYSTVNMQRVRFFDNSTNEDIHDFVACYRKSDSVAGMYDRTTSTFYTNNGSGTFVVGSDMK